MISLTSDHVLLCRKQIQVKHSFNVLKDSARPWIDFLFKNHWVGVQLLFSQSSGLRAILLTCALSVQFVRDAAQFNLWLTFCCCRDFREQKFHLCFAFQRHTLRSAKRKNNVVMKIKFGEMDSPQAFRKRHLSLSLFFNPRGRLCAFEGLLLNTNWFKVESCFFWSVFVESCTYYRNSPTCQTVFVAIDMQNWEEPFYLVHFRQLKVAPIWVLSLTQCYK